MRAKWEIAPEDQGQIIEVAWCAVGQYGMVQRAVDRSTVPHEVRYWLHGWCSDIADEVDVDVQNGSPLGRLVDEEGTEIDHARLGQLLND